MKGRSEVRGGRGTRPVAPKHRKPAVEPVFLHPRSVPNVQIDEYDTDQPFAEGLRGVIDPDLRHRLVSDAAWRHHVEGGYDDASERDDWLDAQSEVDHVLVNR